jgi:hypothetical protein
MNLRVSQQVMEWQNEAKVELQRANVLRILKKRCKASVPLDLIRAILATADMSILTHWFDAAIEANSFEEFRAAIQPQG